MKLSWAVFVFCALGSISSCAADNGRELYDTACASCHGRDGRGASEGTAITELPPLSTVADHRLSAGSRLGSLSGTFPLRCLSEHRCGQLTVHEGSSAWPLPRASPDRAIGRQRGQGVRASDEETKHETFGVAVECGIARVYRPGSVGPGICQ
ncbi:MAG: cytochrome c [Candidatus Methylomirabilis oxyfera]|nr:cytochrome c [Candidatus Methylomirabilis oxyfera]